MSVVSFKRDKTKEQLMEALENFDFEKGAFMVFLNADMDSVDGEWTVVTNYANYSLPELYAADTVRRHIENKVYPLVIEE